MLWKLAILSIAVLLIVTLISARRRVQLTFTLEETFTWLWRLRRKTVTAVCTIAILSFFVSGAALMTQNLSRLSTALDAQIGVIVGVQPDSDTQSLQQQLGAIPGVNGVTFVSQQEELTKAESDFVNQPELIKALQSLPGGLPPYFEVHLTSPDQAAAVADAAKQLPGVSPDMVSWGSAWVTSLITARHSLDAFVLGAVAVIFILSFLQIVMFAETVTSSAEGELRYMRILGASRAQIVLPYALQALLVGGGGAALGAAAMLSVYGTLVQHAAVNMPYLPLVPLAAITSLYLGSAIIVGATLGTFASLFSLRRALRPLHGNPSALPQSTRRFLRDISSRRAPATNKGKHAA